MWIDLLVVVLIILLAAADRIREGLDWWAARQEKRSEEAYVSAVNLAVATQSRVGRSFLVRVPAKGSATAQKLVQEGKIQRVGEGLYVV